MKKSEIKGKVNLAGKDWNRLKLNSKLPNNENESCSVNLSSKHSSKFQILAKINNK